MKNNKQPEIRLSGYVEEWEWRKLNEVSKKVSEKNKDNLYSETLTNSAEFGIVSQRDFFDKDISNKKNLNGYYVVRPDDFVYNPRISNFAPVGPIKRNKLNRTGVMSPLYYVFRTKGVDNAYLERYFSSESWHLFMKLNGDSGARSDRFAIKDAVFGEMPIPFPSMEEQKEMGDFFTQLDEIILLHQQELDTLKQTKQGFLQKMFPKEGESVPEIRFPGFTGKWQLVKVSELFKVTRGQVLASNKTSPIKTIDSPYPVYSSQTKNDGLMGFYEEYLFESAITWTTDGANAGTVNYREGKFYSTNVNGVLLSDEGYANKAVAEALNRVAWKYVSKVGNPKLMNNIMSDIEISLSLNIEEQEKISEFFERLEYLIVIKQQELDALKQTKKAFLQKMFV